MPGVENLPIGLVRCSALVVVGVPTGYAGEDGLFKSIRVGIPGLGDCDAGLDICGCVEGEGLPVTVSSGATDGVTKEPGITRRKLPKMLPIPNSHPTSTIHTYHILVILSYLYHNACSLPYPRVVTNQVLNINIPNLELW